MEDTEDFLDTEFVDLFEHSSNNGSPISRLKTIVLSIDWEINDEVLTQFNDELLVLKDTWAGDQIKLVYVQALEKISKYIYQFKADAHPNAIKLLLTFYYNLEKIVLTTDLSEDEIKDILREDVQKFEHLKSQIGTVPEENVSPSSPESESTPVVAGQSEPHPVLFNLKACILGMDWEITERELADLGEEVERLEGEFAGQKPQMIFLQGISALGGYIKLKKSDAHADAFKLLYSFYEGLEKIVVNPDLSKAEVKAILLPEVEKFEDFKQVIASTITPEAIAEKMVDEQPTAYKGDDSDDVSPAFADVPDEVHGFQAEEEAATIGSGPDDVDNRLDTFFAGEEKPGEAGSEAGVLPPEAIDKIDSFFGDDIVDDALSVSSISAEDALKGVDVETEADDDSDEEALPTHGDGMLAPALADSADEEGHGFNPDLGTEESLYSATNIDESIGSMFMEEAEDSVVTKSAALLGVDVETDADDDSDEQPLPHDHEDIAPALAMEDTDSESADEFQGDTEVTEIDAHIEGFFGDDDMDDGPVNIEQSMAAQGVDSSASFEAFEETVTDEGEVSDELTGNIEERLDTMFAEPDDEVASLDDESDGDLIADEADEVVFEAVGEDAAVAGEDVPVGLLDDEIVSDSEDYLADDEVVAESDAALAVDDEPVSDSEDYLADDEVIAGSDAALAVDDEPVSDSEDYLADDEVIAGSDAALAVDDEPVSDSEDYLADDEVFAESDAALAVDDEPVSDSEAYLADDEVIAESDAALAVDDEPVSDSEEYLADDEVIAESDAALAVDDELVSDSEAYLADDEVIAESDAALAVDDEPVSDSEAYLADDEVIAESDAALSVDDEIVSDSGEYLADEEALSISDELKDADESPGLSTEETVVAGALSSFGSDSEEEDFFAAIDDRIDEPGEIQIELLSETDKLASELVTEHDEADGIDIIPAPDQESDGDLTESFHESSEEDLAPLAFGVEDELSELRAGVASLGVEINDSIIAGILTEINRLRHRMMTKPVEKTYLQLLSTVVQHIGHYKYESSSDAHTLMLSVFDKLELSQKKETDPQQTQEKLLAETCKILLWQQKMLDRQAVQTGDDLTFPTPVRVESADDEGALSIDDGDDTHSGVDSGSESVAEQDFSAVFEPVDDEELSAFEEIEETQEGLEQELGDTFIEDDPELTEGVGETSSVSDTDNLPDIVKEDEKLDFKGLSSLLTDVVKREMKALKDLLQTELKALKDKLKDKE